MKLRDGSRAAWRNLRAEIRCAVGNGHIGLLDFKWEKSAKPRGMLNLHRGNAISHDNIADSRERLEDDGVSANRQVRSG